MDRAAALEQLLRPGTTPRTLVEGVTAGSGDEILRWIVRLLVGALDVDVAFIGELGGDQWERMKTLAVATPTGEADNFEYDIRTGPCGGVVGSETLVVLDGLCERYPHVAHLAQLGAQAYIGTPLIDSVGRPLGVMGVLSRRPITNPDLPRAAVELFVNRVSGELEHRRAVRELHMIIDGATGLSSTDSFHSIVQNLAHILHVRLALVAELIDPQARKVRTLALWDKGRMLDNIEYQLEGTPCDRVYDNTLCFHSRDVSKLYPQDEMLEKMGAEGYMGLPFLASNGEHIGHMCVIHDQPLGEELHSRSLFKVFAARASVELERRRAEENRLRVERSLLEAQKLESLGILAGGVAHDFNNLLVGVMGNASLALAELQEESPLRPYLSEVETAAQRCADLARQLLAFSGKGRFEVEPLDLVDVVREMSNLLQVSIPKKVILRQELQVDLPTVIGDPTQIRQLVMNLVINACEAIGDEEGVVTIASRCVHVDRARLTRAAVGREAPEGDYVLLEVRDTGRGMATETMRRMFDPFFSTKFTGRGLGLAAAQGIVRGHRGALVVSSDEEAGSVFELFLPVAPASQTARSSPAADSGSWRGHGVVLVADDEAPVRAAAAHMLEHLGFEVVLAEDGQEALEVFARRRGEIVGVLLDMTMPGPGAEAVVSEMLRADADTRIVLMSGYDEDEAGSRFEGQGLAGFVHKPFRLEDLRQRLRTALV